MSLDRPLAQHQCLGNLAIRFALRDGRGDLTLAGG